MVGIHLLAIADPVEVDPSSVTQEEQDYLDSVAAWDAQDGAYAHQQMTRPTTLGYGLSDSPACWPGWWRVPVLERLATCAVAALQRRLCVTQASLYWFTNTISTSFRPYYEHARGMREPVERGACADRPGGFPPRPQPAPRSWAERTYKLTRYTLARAGATSPPTRSPSCWATTSQHSSEPCAERTDAHAAAHGLGARVILAVIPPRTTPKTGGVQTDGEEPDQRG